MILIQKTNAPLTGQ